MALTRDFKETISLRVQNDPRLRARHARRSGQPLLNGEPETAKRLLRDLVNATIGFEALANQIHNQPKSLHRMLSASRRPMTRRIAMMLLSCGLPCPESSR